MPLKKILSVVLLMGVFSFCFVSPTFAQDLGLEYGAASGLGNADITRQAVQVINVLLGLIGILLTGLMVYAGFKWMNSGGNDDDIASAKKTIFASIIGLIIILSAWSISSFVLRKSYRATTGNVIQILGPEDL